MCDDGWASAADLAQSVLQGKVTASKIVEHTLARIAKCEPVVNAFSHILADRALDKARVMDAAIQTGAPAGPLAGVPFAAKNLFDIAGLSTLAGSKINADDPPALRDATMIERLEKAGAILVGATHMSEYAYDFTGDNVHYGASRNPHDPDRMSGGSSGGSGGAVAMGLVNVSLGSDTSGSIRVPSSLCGIVGLKPTYGRLSRAGTFPLAPSFDHVGPMARTVRDVALAYDAMQGPDPRDPICTRRPPERVIPQLDDGIAGLRIAVASGYFAKGLFSEAQSAIQQVADALGAQERFDQPETDRARAAAFVITAGEAGELHLDRLRRRAGDFDPAIRDRLLAAVMLPVPFLTAAQKFRRWYRDQVLARFREVDAIIAPATPCTAPKIGEEVLILDGEPVAVRRHLGLYTQPLSFIGLPVVVVPIPLAPMPIGVQIVTAPWNEAAALRIARYLEQVGVVRAPIPAGADRRTQAAGSPCAE